MTSINLEKAIIENNYEKRNLKGQWINIALRLYNDTKVQIKRYQKQSMSQKVFNDYIY